MFNGVSGVYSAAAIDVNMNYILIWMNCAVNMKGTKWLIDPLQIP